MAFHSSWRGSRPAAGPVPGGFFVDFSTLANQDPIAQVDKWLRLLDPAFTTTCRVNAGLFKASASSSGNNDSVSFLDPAVTTILPRQTAIVSMAVLGAFGPAEMEVHLRITSSSGSTQTYECDLINSLNVCNLEKWNGAQGGVNQIPFTNGTNGNFVGGAIGNNDKFKCEVSDNGLVGAALVVTLKVSQQVGGVGAYTLIAQGDDSFAIMGSNAFASGSVGLGGDVGAGNADNIAIRDLLVSSS